MEIDAVSKDKVIELAVYKFEDRIPQINPSAYVHEFAVVIGRVTVGDSCFIGAGAVIRGDYGSVEVGERTSVQENAVIHAREGEYCKIGSDVQIGHGAILHNCEVSDYAVIGLGSRICDYAKIGTWSIIGEGATVSSGSEIPSGKVAVGVPARVLRDVKEEEKILWGRYKEKYAELCQRYKDGLTRIR
jgi:phenylacetic acid degradation protein